MLPDFPELKRDIAHRLLRSARRRAQDGPLLNQIPSFVQHEGNRCLFGREDTTTGVIDYDNPITTEVTIAMADARRDGAAASMKAAQRITEQLADAMEQRMFASIEEAVKHTGNRIDGGGKPFSVDMLLELMSTMELSFDEAGQWVPPTFAVHPTAVEKIMQELARAESDPDAKARMDAIITRQREEWRAREARRTLAD